MVSPYDSAPADPESRHPMTSLPMVGTIALSFRIFARAPWKFLALLVLEFLLAAIVGILAAFLTKEPYHVALNIVAQLVEYVVQVAISGAISIAVAEIVASGTFDFEGALGTGFRRVLPLFGVFILQSIVFALGIILFVIPGIIAVLMFGLAIPICAAEGLGPIRSLDRSKALTKGQRWRILGLGLSIVLAMLVAGGVVFGLVAAHLLFVAVPLALGVVLAFVIVALILPVAIFLQLRAIADGRGRLVIPPHLG